MAISLIDELAALRLVTGFGDPVFLLSAAAALFLYLRRRRLRNVAFAWGGAIVLCGALSAAAKLGFQTCGGDVGGLQIRSPSGHAALAVIFYGGAAVLLGRGRPLLARCGIGLAAVLLIAGIAVSRVVLGMHSAAEVVSGGLIGLATLAVFATLTAQSRGAALPLGPAVVLVAVVGFVTWGLHVDVERVIAGISRRFQSVADLCMPDLRAAVRPGLREESAGPLLGRSGQ